MVINVNVKEKIIEVQSEFTIDELAEFIELYVGTDWILKLNPNNATKEEEKKEKKEKEEKEEKKEFHHHYHYHYEYPYRYNWPFRYDRNYPFINYDGTITTGIPLNETVTINGYSATTAAINGTAISATNVSTFYNSDGEMSFTNGTYTKK